MVLPHSTKERNLNKNEDLTLFIRTINTKILESLQTGTPTVNSPLRSTIYAPNLDLKDILPLIDSFPLFFWEGKTENTQKFLAIGQHSSLKNLSSLEGISPDAYPFCIVGGETEPTSHNDAHIWADYQQAPFIIPKIIISQQQDNFTIELASNIKILFSEKNSHVPLSILKKEELPPINEWSKQIQEVLGDITANYYSKIVLSRQQKLALKGNVLTSMLQNFQKKDNSYNLLWALSPEHFFVAQSPETLFKQEDNTIYVDSLAGTIQRGDGQQQDQQKREELLHSLKDHHEHQIVTDFLLEQLTELCTSIEYLKKEEIVQLPHVQHLHTKLKGTLKKETSPHHVINQLHPTPAVGGFPQKSIRKIIAKKEQFDRGLYTAPIGFVTPKSSEFLVGIRSALFFKSNLHIYAGAGIVTGSDPMQEWLETENKMKTIIELL